MRPTGGRGEEARRPRGRPRVYPERVSVGALSLTREQAALLRSLESREGSRAGAVRALLDSALRRGT